MKKFLSLTVAALLAMGVLASCGTNEQAPVENEEAVEETVTEEETEATTEEATEETAEETTEETTEETPAEDAAKAE